MLSVMPAHRETANIPVDRLSNDIICLQQDRLGYDQPYGFRGPEIEHEVELGGLLNRQIARLGTLEDLVHIRGRSVPVIHRVSPIGHESAFVSESSIAVHRRKAGFR